MASKEVMIVTPDEIESNFTLTKSALDTYKFLLAHAGIEMDEATEREFIAQRNLRINEIVELKAFQAWCEKAAASIKETFKHTFNIGSADSLPPNVSWNKQSFTYEFAEGAGHIVANDLMERGIVTVEKILDGVTPTALSKAADIKTEKLVEMFGDEVVIPKAKERTLKIK